MSALSNLEDQLNDYLVKKAPPLPEGAKKFLVTYLPWINLFLALVTLYSVWLLWHWAHYANKLADWANQISAAYGGSTVAVHRLTVGVWISLIVLAIQAVIYLLAFQPLRDHKKNGWNLMFYAQLVYIAYGVVVLFTEYGGVGNLLSSLIGAVIGLYLLFQTRASYLRVGSRTAAAK